MKDKCIEEDIWRIFPCPRCGHLIKRKIFYKSDLVETHMWCDRCGAKIGVMDWKVVKKDG